MPTTTRATSARVPSRSARTRSAHCRFMTPSPLLMPTAIVLYRSPTRLPIGAKLRMRIFQIPRPPQAQQSIRDEGDARRDRRDAQDLAQGKPLQNQTIENIIVLPARQDLVQ